MIDGTLTGNATPGQSEARSNGNEGIFYTPEITWIEASPSEADECHTQNTIVFFLCGGESLTPLQWGKISVFKASPTRWKEKKNMMICRGVKLEAVREGEREKFNKLPSSSPSLFLQVTIIKEYLLTL